MSDNTAILLFSRSASAEASAKFSGSRHGERVAKTLIDRTRKTLRQSGFPVYHLDESNQLGRCFGEKLESCLSRVFRLGYDQVIVVGNDCPQLRAGHLRKASKLLSQGREVLGQDRRGGIWLLGLRDTAFNREAVIRAPWQSGELFQALRAIFPIVALLPFLQDFNALSDYRRAYAPWKAILSGLSFLVGRQEEWYETQEAWMALTLVTPVEGRGPPRAA